MTRWTNSAPAYEMQYPAVLARRAAVMASDDICWLTPVRVAVVKACTWNKTVFGHMKALQTTTVDC